MAIRTIRTDDDPVLRKNLEKSIRLILKYKV